MTSMGGFPFSLEMRDTIKKLVVEEVDRSRPRYRYATVIKIDRDKRKCSVVFNGETGAVQVNMGSIQPSAVNQVVRVEGIGVDKYITDVIGDAFYGIRTGRIQPLYTSGKPYVTWDGDSTLSGPYEVFSAYSPSQYDVVQGIFIPGRGYVLYPVQDFLTNMPYARWHSLTLKNGWNEYDGVYGVPKFTKSASGIVKLQGLIKGGSQAAGSVIATLPPGFRPAKPMMFASEIASGSVGGSIDVDAVTGDIYVRNVLSAYTSLDQVSFPCAEVAPNSAWNNVTPLSSGWQNYDLSTTPYWAPASWWKDADGVIWQRGLVRRTDNANTTGSILYMPAGTRASTAQSMHRRSTAGNQFACVQVYTDGNTAYASGDAGTYLSLDGMPYYPEGVQPNWISAGYQNGWVDYGAGWTSGQFTKTKSGHVMLKGLMKGGTVGAAAFFTLPPGYRPARRLLLGGVANGVKCRIDIQPDGQVLGMDQTSGVWTSIDSLNFMAEQ